MTEPIDIHKSEPPAVVEKAPQQTGAEKAMQDINARLALNGLKAELPKSIPEQEKEVLSIVINKTFKDVIDKGLWSVEEISIKYIDKGVFAFINKKTGNPNYYLNESGEVLFNIGTIKERPYVNNGKVFEDLSILEKEEQGIYKLYRISGYKADGGKEPILNGPIDVNSKEYYKLWQDIIFQADVYDKLHILKNQMKESKNGIRLFAKHGAFKFEDLELFKEKGIIDESIFSYGINELRKVIISQCSDSRLIKLGIGIKESDIKKYLEKGYIDAELAKKCYQALPEEMKGK